jgi:hypothetical protein
MRDANIRVRIRAFMFMYKFHLFEYVMSRQFLALYSSRMQYAHVFPRNFYYESQFDW